MGITTTETVAVLFLGSALLGWWFLLAAIARGLRGGATPAAPEKLCPACGFATVATRSVEEAVLDVLPVEEPPATAAASPVAPAEEARAPVPTSVQVTAALPRPPRVEAEPPAPEVPRRSAAGVLGAFMEERNIL